MQDLHSSTAHIFWRTPCHAFLPPPQGRSLSPAWLFLLAVSTHQHHLYQDSQNVNPLPTLDSSVILSSRVQTKARCTNNEAIRLVCDSPPPDMTTIALQFRDNPLKECAPTLQVRSAWHLFVSQVEEFDANLSSRIKALRFGSSWLIQPQHNVLWLRRSVKVRGIEYQRKSVYSNRKERQSCVCQPITEIQKTMRRKKLNCGFRVSILLAKQAVPFEHRQKPSQVKSLNLAHRSKRSAPGGKRCGVIVPQVEVLGVCACGPCLLIAQDHRLLSTKVAPVPIKA